MKKELIIGAKLELESQAFIQGVKQAQDSLSKIYSSPQNMDMQRQIDQKLRQLGMGGLPGAPGNAQAAKAQQKADEDRKKMLQESLKSYDGIVKQEENIRKNLDQQKQLKRDTAEIEKQLNATLEERKKKEGEIADLVERQSQSKKSQSEKQRLDDQIALRNLTAVSGIIATVGKIIGAEGRLPIEAKSAMGQANEALIAGQARQMLDPYQQAFLPERQKAMDAAKKAWKAGRVEDKFMNIAGTIALAAGMAGLAVAEVGTLGLATPAVLTAGAGMAAGAGILFGSSKQRALSAGNNEAYEQLSAKDLANLYQTAKEAEENANPIKKIAAEYNAQHYQTNLATQRNLGLSDTELYGQGGFLQKGMAPGGRMQFTEEQVNQMQQSIMGAGGSARMGREAGFGLQLQKNLDLINAPQMLGQLSSTMGTAQGSQQAAIKVIGGAFREGLDKSEFVDELRSFTQTASEFIARAGARDQSDVQRITDKLAQATTENTQVGMQSARNAYESYQQAGATNTGPYGVMQRAALMRNPLYRKLLAHGEEGQAVFEKITQLRPDEMSESHPAVQAAIGLLGNGVTAKDLISGKQQALNQSVSKSAKFYQYRNKVDDFQTRTGIKVTKENRDKGLIPDDVWNAANIGMTIGTTQGLGIASDKTKAQDIESYFQTSMTPIPEQGGQVPAGFSSMAEYQASQKIGDQDNKRSADQVNANVAASQTIFIDNFVKFKDEIVPTADRIDDLTKKLILLGAAAAAYGSKDPKAVVDQAAKTLGSQPQADSSGSGKGISPKSGGR